MKQKKVIVNIRLNPLTNMWFTKEAQTQCMNKSELMRRVLTEYKKKHTPQHPPTKLPMYNK